MMNSEEYLAVPYLLEAEAVEAEPGKWLVRLAYPELEGCTAEGIVVENVLQELERRRVEMIIAMIESGQAPPVPRAPVGGSDPRWTAQDLGLSQRVAALMGKSV